MSSKFNVSDIIIDHVKTLRNDATKQYQKADFGISFLVPAAISIVLVGLGLVVNSTIAIGMITAFSIFGALLLNLLLLLYQMVNGDGSQKNEKLPRVNMLKRAQLLKETYSNISFEILLAIIVIVILLFTIIVGTNNVAVSVLSFFDYFVGFTFVITLTMVLKRVHRLVSMEFESSGGN